MSGGGVEADDIDELLERVRSLQRLLPSPREQNCLPVPNIPHTYVKEFVSDKRRRENTGYGVENVPLDPHNAPHIPTQPRQVDQIAEESLELLKQVTFIRIVIDKIEWQQIPQFMNKEFGGSKSPRNRSQLVVEYEIPSVDNTYATLKKRVRMYAKNVVPQVALLNHRRVALLQINASLLQLWTKASIWFKILIHLPNTGQVKQIGRAHLPLERLLVAPFCFDDNLRIDVAHNEIGEGKATMKISIELGSRHTSFTDRVQQIRNSMRGQNRRHNKVAIDHQKIINAFGNDQPPPPTAHENACATAGILKSSKQVKLKPNKPRPTYEYPSRINGVVGNSVLDRRESHGVILSGGNGVNRGNEGVVEIGVQSNEWKSTGSQTESKDNRSTQHSASRTRESSTNVHEISLDTQCIHVNHDLSLDRARPRNVGTVAERLTQSWSEYSHANTYELTIHSAKDLPLVKGARGEAVCPSVYVSYQGDQQMISGIVKHSVNPEWNWTTILTVKPDRKTIVVKVWHDCKTRGPKVLGFVCIDLSSIGNGVTSGNYDLVDLSQSSTGNIKVTLRQLGVSHNEEHRNVMDESMFPRVTPTHEQGVNTSFLPVPQANPRISPIDPYLELASRINMNELDQMVNGLGTTTEYRRE